MEILKLNPSDWEKYKDLRLEALQKDSAAFGSSYEESLKKADEEWKKKIENPKSYIFVARDGDNFFGMAAAYQEEGEKVEHIAYVWGMYVRDSYRGKGIGKKLMQAVLDELQANSKIKKANLNVNTKQATAVKMYGSLGFKIAGTLHRELKEGEEYFDEYLMEKMF
jgi:ribosomal protein S18 acetylase RimI-like enzyme